MKCQTYFDEKRKAIRCSVCGRTFHPAADLNTRAQCRPKEPGITQKAVGYLAATERWIAAGRPTRDQREIIEILNICRGCPQYTEDGRQRCRLCGCSVNSQDDGLRNKIAMATEGCPATPPRWSPKT